MKVSSLELPDKKNPNSGPKPIGVQKKSDPDLEWFSIQILRIFELKQIFLNQKEKNSPLW